MEYRGYLRGIANPLGHGNPATLVRARYRPYHSGPLRLVFTGDPHDTQYYQRWSPSRATGNLAPQVTLSDIIGLVRHTLRTARYSANSFSQSESPEFLPNFVNQLLQNLSEAPDLTKVDLLLCTLVQIDSGCHYDTPRKRAFSYCSLWPVWKPRVARENV